MKTSFSNKCGILGELWLSYRDEEAFKDFVEYNDLGLPLAYAISEDLIEPSEKAETLISESFFLLLEMLKIEDTGFESIDELLDKSAS